MAHRNARLTEFGRLLLVQRITELGWPPAQAADALAIRHENRVGPILRRAREVRASLEPWRDEQPVKELDEQLHPLLSA